MGKKLLLFDLDGVLLDSRLNMSKAWEAVQSQLNIQVSFERYFAQIGRPFGDIMKSLGLRDHAHEAERVFRVASMKNLHLLEFFPGVESSLVEAHTSGFQLGVVTSKDKMRTDAILALLPVEFVTVRTPEPGYRGKPAPDHLLAACAEANRDPCETLYVGDMFFDYSAAFRAGIDYVHVRWGYGDRPADCSRTVNSMRELLDLAYQWS